MFSLSRTFKATNKLFRSMGPQHKKKNSTMTISIRMTWTQEKRNTTEKCRWFLIHAYAILWFLHIFGFSKFDKAHWFVDTHKQWPYEQDVMFEINFILWIVQKKKSVLWSMNIIETKFPNQIRFPEPYVVLKWRIIVFSNAYDFSNVYLWFKYRFPKRKVSICLCDRI